ncbi:hypothetical protein H257_02711 [Aphanomyces astaci]|uniref:Major facilitator superfamily (MFS) profile domain-containing protein n=1 Tax=Aphanomyces astaci TaxID=112090 RepID=W4H325_APHAT|nr:hypothetical protein H257_02711 [Aphanomyces astaci]ETV86292.1 hypothetical protein H257_02711 [Aphanomyces astaci]RQM29909.1 hypothetical protein B5M09_004986 [Aphanomyces astaci]|eukprot:XP_009824764.1 hypothetical protein H257_02711 [Aphanomyces astaci]
MEPLEIQAASPRTKTVASSPAERRLLNVLFALIGVGYLFPFSALTQPVDYWTFLFPDFNIEFSITCVFLYTNLIALALIVSFGSTPWFTGRIVGGFAGQLAVLVFVPAVYEYVSGESAHVWSILGATAFAAIVTAFLDSCVISLASKYPLHAQESLQFGIGLSTLIGSIYRDVTKVVFPPDAVIASSSLYFYTGAVTVGLCIGAYYMLRRLPISKFMLSTTTSTPPTHESLPLIQPPKKQQDHKGDYDSSSQNLTTTKAPIDRWAVLGKCVHNQMQVALLFMTTLTLWPPLVTEMQSHNFPSLQASGWWPLILLTVFSISDCIGRLLVSYRCGLTKANVWKPVLLRMLLVPCIVMSVQGIAFNHDALSVLFVLVLGATNGYHGSLAILFVSECVGDDEKAIAGSFTGFFLNFGLVLGSSFGLILSQFIHTPQ